MLDGRVLSLALDLAEDPRLAQQIRRRPLPPNVISLIRIAAGDATTTAEAVRLAGQAHERIKAAAVLFVQQSLFEAHGDHYRTLGVAPTATRSELAEHVRWLMKWLHPDRDHGFEWDSVLAERVLSAWHELKDPERRARYDRATQKRNRVGGSARGSPRSKLTPKIMLGTPTKIRLRQALLVLLVCTSGLAIILLSDRISGIVAGSVAAADR